MVRSAMACRIPGLVRGTQQSESRYPAGSQYPVRSRFIGSHLGRRVRRRGRYHFGFIPDPDFNDEIVFNPEHPNWLLHKELLKACKAKANGHYYVGMPDLMEGLDVLAALKGTDKVFAGYRDAARSAGTANATNQ